MVKKLKILALLLILVFLAKSGYAMDVGNLNSKGNVTVKGSVRTDTLQNATGGDTVTVTNLADAVTKKHSQNTDTGTTGNFNVAGTLSAGNPTSPSKTVEVKLSDTAGADSVVVRDSAGTIIATIGSNGNIVNSGEIYTDASGVRSGRWLDFTDTANGDTSVIVGWSSYTAGRRKIFTKKVGKLVFVQFHLEGTSNATTVSFTVPYTSTTDGSAYPYTHVAVSRIIDNGTGSTTGGHLELDANTSTVNIYTNMTTGAWTNSGSKIVAGEFWYQCQ